MLLVAMVMRMLLLLVVVVVAGKSAKKVGGEFPEATRLLGASVVRERRGPPPRSPFLGQLQGVLQATGTLEYKGVFWVAVALAAHLDATKLVGVVQIRLTFPLNVDSVPALVGTLNCLGDDGTAARRAPGATELGHGGGPPPRRRELAPVQSQDLDVPQQDATGPFIPAVDSNHRETKMDQNNQQYEPLHVDFDYYEYYYEYNYE